MIGLFYCLLSGGGIAASPPGDFFPSAIANLEVSTRAATGVRESQPRYPSVLSPQECLDMPRGDGIPGFRPGIDRRHVLQMFGTPSGIEPGYWPNTEAVFYILIPERVSVGFLFDRDSGRLRQTEVAFAQEVENELMLATFDSMSGCNLNEELRSGLLRVIRRQVRRFPFAIDSLRGVIQRDGDDRIYIGIWEADLH